MELIFHTVIPRWMQTIDSDINKAVSAQSFLQDLCSTWPNSVHLRMNLNVPSS